ncbi:MAG: hypothetical protein K1V84_05045 [Muribaculaceae bacterium]
METTGYHLYVVVFSYKEEDYACPIRSTAVLKPGEDKPTALLVAEEAIRGHFPNLLPKGMIPYPIIIFSIEYGTYKIKN